MASVDEIEKNAAHMLRADRNKMDKNETEMKGDDEDQDAAPPPPKLRPRRPPKAKAKA